MLQATPRHMRRDALLVSLAAVVIVFVLWNVPAFDSLLYPFRLFVTYVHEAGHSLMALLTGGRVLGFVVSADGSGFATTAGGSRALILPAGYLGAAAFGAVLFYTINTVRYPRSISIILGVLLAVFSVMFARPGNSVIPLSLTVGLLFALVLVGMGLRANRTLNLLLLNILAMMTGLNAVLDIFALIRHTNATLNTGSGMIRNDAAAFSSEVMPFVPPVVWALLWAGLAILMLGAAVYYSVLRPWARGE